MTDGKYALSAKISAAVFAAAQVVLFPLIQTTSGDVSSFYSYLSIILVGLFALITIGYTEEYHLLRLGILFTLVADFFLVVCYDRELEGVIAFIFVQAAYCAYLVLAEKRRCVRRANVLTRLALSAALVITASAVLGEDTDLLAIASVLYYGNLLTNTVFAFVLGKSDRVFAIGLLLFCMCDLCIGLEVLTDVYLDSDAFSFVYGRNLNLPWVFYQPSQTLIGIQMLKKKKLPIR